MRVPCHLMLWVISQRQDECIVRRPSQTRVTKESVRKHGREIAYSELWIYLGSTASIFSLYIRKIVVVLICFRRAFEHDFS